MNTFYRILPFVLTKQNITRLLVISIGFSVLFSVPFQTAQASGTITGTVYIDYNMNGARNTGAAAPNYAVDAGLGGVTVTAYDSGGTAQGSATSCVGLNNPTVFCTGNNDGAYSLAATGTGPYRIEFTGIPAGYSPSAVGTNNASTVRIVPNGNSSNVDLGIIEAKEYCQNNPFIVTNAYALGNGTFDTIVKYPYNYSEELDGRLNSVDPTAWTTAPSRTAQLAPIGIAAVNPVGATFGLSWNNLTDSAYAAAYLKRGARFGSLSGESTGAIYVTQNPTTGTPSTNLFVDLNAAFGAGTAGVNTHPSSTTTDWSDDAASTSEIGKRGLGGLKLSADGATLYTVNLADKRLYAIPTSGALNSSTITRFNIPTSGLATSSGNCAATDVRPFGLGKDKSGQIYVGAVCSAESTANNSQLHAYVWRFNGSAFTLVANRALTFVRTAATGEPVTWNYWANTTGVLNRAAPMLTDIEFDGTSMILAFRDRYGDQVVFPDYYRGYGDILRACANGTNFDFESNGSCGGLTAGGAGTDEGPGGGEYYADLNGDEREEGGLGGLVQVPGFNHVITTFYDPVTFNSAGTRVTNYYTAGIQRYSNTTGAMTGAYDVYMDSDPGNFGKADGIGDSEVLCDSAPLQIGNRVWLDSDNDGVQDSNESGIQNVGMQLWADTNNDTTIDTQIGSVATDASGNYVFGGAANTNLTTYACSAGATVDRRVEVSSDDAEQTVSSGAVVINGNDLEITRDGTAQQLIGVRFNYLNIPQGATITNAYLEFTPKTGGDAINSGNPTITIRAQNADDAATFTTTANNISGRATTTASTSWTPPNWTLGTPDQTPNISNVLQEVVNRAGWTSGNSMALILSGSASNTFRRTWSRDGDVNAPRLVVQYTTSSTCSYEINPNTRYEVRIPAANFNSGQPLNGRTPSTPNTDGTANGDSRDSDGLSLAGSQIVAPLTTGGVGQNNHTYDFGFTAASTYSIGNRVWFDTDNDGILDAAEVGISNVSVSLFADANTDGQPDTPAVPIGTLTTDASGYYRFDALAAGSYVVRINPANFGTGGALRGYANTSGNNTADADSRGAVSNAENGINPATPNAVQTGGILSNTITLSGTAEPTAEPDIAVSGIFAGQGALDNRADVTVDFGFYRLSLNGTVWNDTSAAGNNDGILNNGESGIPSIAVRLYTSAGAEIPVGADGILGTADDAIGGMTTNAGGDYNFQGLAPGTYRVVVTSNGGTSSTPTDTNPDNNDDNDDNGFPDNTGNFTGKVISGLIVLSAGGEPIVNNAAGSTSNPTVDFGFVLAPTAIQLESFDAFANSDGSVTLKWSTGGEADNLGFNVYREFGGKREMLNDSPIAGSALRSSANLQASGDSYSWFDAKTVPGAVYYLEDIDLAGSTNLHGAISAKMHFSSVNPNLKSTLLSDLANLSAAPKQIDAVEIASAKPAAGNRAVQDKIAAQTGVKLTVKKDGWYRVSAEQLQAAGFEVSSRQAFWQMFANAEEVPLKINSDNSIEFFGRGLDTPATDKQTYYLTVGDQNGLRVGEVKGGRITETNGANSFRNVTVRRDRGLYASAILNGDAENWFGAVVNSSGQTAQDLTVYNPDATGGEARLTVKLQGLTMNEHLVSVRFNDYDLGTVNYSNRENSAFEFNVPANLIQSGANRVSLQAIGAGSDVSVVDSITLNYARLYKAENDRLHFTVSAGQAVRVTGFVSDEIGIYEIRNGKVFNQLSSETEKDGGTRNFSLSAVNYEREILALGKLQSDQVLSAEADASSDWRNPSNEADFVIITPNAFRDSAGQLAQLRQSQGLKTEVVAVEDLYDEFTFGAHSPEAVKEFLRTAASKWKIKPQFALLFGDSSYDSRNYLGGIERNLVPAKLIDTENLETASDAWLADFDNDGIEDIALGRLPVVNQTEAAAMITKLRRYERRSAREEKTNLFVSDVNFENYSNTLRGLLPENVGASFVNRTGATDSEMRQELLQKLNLGATVVTYSGHGSNTLLTGGNIFRNPDALNLSNQKLSFYLMMTCLNGFTHNASTDSLAESLMKSSNGAIAVWASSGTTHADGQSQLSQSATNLLFNSPQPLRIGAIVRTAKQSTGDQDIRRTWQLIGDPTVFVR